MAIQDELAALFSRDLTRIVQELEAFPEGSALWETRQGISNSAGNLVLHLEGNLREYIGRQLGNVAYERRRDQEFASSGVVAADLVRRMNEVREIVVNAIGGLSENQMSSNYPERVLGRDLTTTQFLIHLLGHLNYHLGQIDYLRRVLTGNGAITLAGL